ncbi:A/G-specific adenine glycosylase, partial [Acidobacteriota bacterium]
MVFPVKRLIDWFHENKRDLPWRGSMDIYKIWLSEVMLQQTQVTTVIPYYHRFLREFPDVKSLAGADEESVLKLWEGLGYYNRCRNLHHAARKILSHFKGNIPDTPETFSSLPGVGPYILAAVMSMARGYPMPAVDGNVIRVYCRFIGIKENIRQPKVIKRITEELEKIIPAESPGGFNEAMMELGAILCSPKKPACSACPLNRECVARLTSQQDVIPFKSAPKKAPRYRISIAIILKGAKFYIQKRPAGGHLGGMWEFPGGKR